MSPMIQIRPPPPHRKRRHCHNESSLTWKCGLETHLEICLKSGSWILTNCVGSMTSRISSSSPRNITCSAVEEGQYQQHTRWLLLLLFWGFFAFSNKWASPLFDCRFLARTSVSLWWPERRCHSSYSWLLFPPPHPPLFFFLNTSIWVYIIITVMSFFTFLTLSLMWNTFMTNWEGEWKMNVTQRWLIGGVVHRYLLVLLMLGLSLGIVQCNTPTVRRGIRRLKLTSH